MVKVIEFNTEREELKKYLEEWLKEENVYYEMKIEERWLERYKEASKYYQVYCLYLNEKKELIEWKLLFMGTVNKSLVHPREIFKEAYLLSASSIICMHNHPSGNPNPSTDDIVLTSSLLEIGKIQKIPIVDHIIFGSNSYYSFYENNNLEWKIYEKV